MRTHKADVLRAAGILAASVIVSIIIVAFYVYFGLVQLESLT